MELKVPSQRRGLSSSNYSSDPDEKEISEDEDDDRNHKHRRKDPHSHSLEGDSLDQSSTRPYRKRNRPFENGFSYREVDPQSGEPWKRDYPPRFEKRRANQASFSRAPLDLNPRIRGNQTLGRGRGPVSWGLLDVPSGLFAGRGIPNAPNAQSTSWNAFGLVPGVVPNGGLDALHPLGLQGAMNIGIPRQRCRDFEERGFCLRGDMCPMEHGVNRIVIDDVQSLSQFNLPVSLPGSQLMGTSSAQGALPVISTASGSLMNSKAFHAKSSNSGMIEDGLGLNGGPMAGASDVYDPDQPLWTSDNPETSAALLALNQSNAAGETESFLDMEQNNEAYEGFDDAGPTRKSITAGSQNPSVWGRISSNSSRHRLGLKEKMDSAGTSSSYLEQDIKSVDAPNTGLPNVPIVNKESTLKRHSDSVGNTRKPSHKALRTLFVNGIPLKDNKREALLSHFRKFGEVIDIYIPTHSERAFVQFSKRVDAEAALKAPDAVMGNRFIKLWWANRDNIPDNNGISGTSNVPISSRGMTVNHALSRPILDKGKENPQSEGGKDGNNTHATHMVANGPKAPPPQQKKMESLELLKEELRKKQEMLDQKRNEFRRQLVKLEKQTPGSKDVTLTDLTPKRLRGETPPDHAKAESSKSSPRDNNIIVESTTSAEKAVPHTSSPKPAVSVPGSLRPLIRPMASLGSPFTVNRFKLDNRPTAFKIISPLPDGLANVAALEVHFSTYGELSKVELEESELQETKDDSAPSEVSARVSFTTRRSAEKAFTHGKCWQGHNLQFTWLKSTNPGKESGVSGNPSTASNIPPSDANVQLEKETSSTDSRKIAALGSGEVEQPTKESDAESVELDKCAKSSTTTISSEK